MCSNRCVVEHIKKQQHTFSLNSTNIKASLVNLFKRGEPSGAAGICCALGVYLMVFGLVNDNDVTSKLPACQKPGGRNESRGVIKTQRLGFNHLSLDYRATRERLLLVTFKLHVCFMCWRLLNRFFKPQNQRFCCSQDCNLHRVCDSTCGRQAPGALGERSFFFSCSNKDKSLTLGIRAKVKAAFFYPV